MLCCVHQPTTLALLLVISGALAESVTAMEALPLVHEGLLSAAAPAAAAARKQAPTKYSPRRRRPGSSSASTRANKVLTRRPTQSRVPSPCAVHSAQLVLPAWTLVVVVLLLSARRCSRWQRGAFRRRIITVKKLNVNFRCVTFHDSVTKNEIVGG